MGIHGGEVVVSQEGDIRRAIGIWGDAINVAARLEHAGGVLGKPCIISRDVVAEIGVHRASSRAHPFTLRDSRAKSQPRAQPDQVKRSVNASQAADDGESCA